MTIDAIDQLAASGTSGEEVSVEGGNAQNFSKAVEGTAEEPKKEVPAGSNQIQTPDQKQVAANFIREQSALLADLQGRMTTVEDVQETGSVLTQLAQSVREFHRPDQAVANSSLKAYQQELDAYASNPMGKDAVNQQIKIKILAQQAENGVDKHASQALGHEIFFAEGSHSNTTRIAALPQFLGGVFQGVAAVGLALTPEPTSATKFGAAFTSAAALNNLSGSVTQLVSGEQQDTPLKKLVSNLTDITWAGDLANFVLDQGYPKAAVNMFITKQQNMSSGAALAETARLTVGNGISALSGYWKDAPKNIGNFATNLKQGNVSFSPLAVNNDSRIFPDYKATSQGLTKTPFGQLKPVLHKSPAVEMAQAHRDNYPNLSDENYNKMMAAVHYLDLTPESTVYRAAGSNFQSNYGLSSLQGSIDPSISDKRYRAIMTPLADHPVDVTQLTPSELGLFWSTQNNSALKQNSGGNLKSATYSFHGVDSLPQEFQQRTGEGILDSNIRAIYSYNARALSNIDEPLIIEAPFKGFLERGAVIHPTFTANGFSGPTLADVYHMGHKHTGFYSSELPFTQSIPATVVPPVPPAEPKKWFKFF